MRFVRQLIQPNDETRRLTASQASSNGAGPDFLCIGGQRSGTGWLYENLAVHPDFWMPPRKELHYFDQLGRAKRFGPPRSRDARDVRFVEAMDALSNQPSLDLDGYARLFDVKGALISGDITPAYSTLEDEIIARIMKRFPYLKVIFLARDPVERALSQFLMEVDLGISRPFNIADVAEVIGKLQRPGVLARSHPSKIVARWRSYVPADQFRLNFFDELESAPATLFSSIVQFLGGRAPTLRARLKAKCKVNVRGKRQFPERVRLEVARFFDAELKTCSAELNGPAAHWPTRYGL
jgi:hypothetical protein